MQGDCIAHYASLQDLVFCLVEKITFMDTVTSLSCWREHPALVCQDSFGQRHGLKDKK